MAEQGYHVEIITPEKVLFSEDVDSMEAPGVSGEFQVLEDHTPFLSGLATGLITISISGNKSVFSISGGFCEVQPDKTVVLAHSAEAGTEINVERAESARNRAQERLGSQAEDIDEGRAKAALARSLNRLKLAGMIENS